ncbi:gamma-aminobutyric acid receptor subunit beta-1-like [Branchiostoma lanceolatum]|uniref:gamma-aminobutyric acid receptor subunit beta-1-like n=1 Tax=Branchiostoma lanceolatum TaxID=7740 RepID=UPI003452DC6C
METQPSFVLMLLAAMRFCARADDSSTSPSTIDHILAERGYDRHLRPNFGGAPVVVRVSMSIASIDQVSEVNMDYMVTIFLRQYWQDNRLAFEGTTANLTLDGRLSDRLWVPDLFIPNSKQAFLHKVTVDNKLLRLHPDGTVLYGQRITAKVACTMDLRNYPLDEQNCTLQYESYGYTTQDVLFLWKDGNASIHGLEDIEIAQFDIGGFTTSENHGYYETGEYPRLTFCFRLHRNVVFIILQTYLPAILLVISSWVSFFINPEAVPARVTLGITTVLTMTTLSSAAKESLPKISYIKAIDVYLAMCFFFVFAALLEYAIVNFSSVGIAKKQASLQGQQEKSECHVCRCHDVEARVGGLNGVSSQHTLRVDIENEAAQKETSFSLPDDVKDQCKSRGTFLPTQSSYADGAYPTDAGLDDGEGKSRWPLAAAVTTMLHHIYGRRPQIKNSNNIDKYSRVMFPLLFVVLNIVYWSVYLYRRHYFVVF